MVTERSHTRLRSALIAAAWLAACTFSLAQGEMKQRDRLHEFAVGYGWNALTKNKIYSERDNVFHRGNLYLQYLYNMSSHIGLGVMVDYTHSYITTHDVVPHYDDVGHYIGGHLTDERNGTEWFTISPTARFYWFNHKHFAMYSRVGLGLLLSAGYERKRSVMPNISPVSVEIGGTRLRFCTELFSIGSYGEFNGGLKYSF